MTPSTPLTRRTLVKLLAASPLAVPAIVRAQPAGAFQPTATLPDVSLQDIGLPEGTSIVVADNRNYWALYPRDENLSIRQVDRLDEGVGLRFAMAASGFPLDHLEVSGEGEAETWSEENSFLVRFPQTVSLTAQHHRITLRGVAANGERTPEYFLNLQYNSNAQDAAAGRTAFSRITVRDSNLQLAYSQADDWIINAPSESDQAFAQKHWGHLFTPGDSNLEVTRAVTRQLITDFEPRRGTPSDVMNGLHPFRQFERLLADEDRCWCANICEIISHALNSLGVPCRLIRMRNTFYNAAPGIDGRDFELLLAGGHTVPEIYDRDSGQWIFFDPTLRRLGVRDAAGHFLNFFELHLQVNQPHRAAGLKLDAFDPATGKVTVESFDESEVKPNLSHYAKREQRFYYFKRGA